MNFSTNVELTTGQKEKAAVRAKEVREIIGSKLCVEAQDIYSQRPQKDLELFLNHLGPYRNVATKGTLTRGDPFDSSTQTERPMTEEKETQAPSLVLAEEGSIAARGQLLPFLRRTLPLFEAIFKNQRKKGDKTKPGENINGQNSDTMQLVNTLHLDFGIPKAVLLIKSYRGAPHVCVNFEMNTQISTYNSVLAIYPLDSLGESSSEPSGTRKKRTPTRLFYSFETISSFDVLEESNIIVAGTAAGSLLLYDLRQVPVATTAAANVSVFSKNGKEKERTTSKGRKSADAEEAEENIAKWTARGSRSKENLEKPEKTDSKGEIADLGGLKVVEEPPAFSTDAFSLDPIDETNMVMADFSSAAEATALSSGSTKTREQKLKGSGMGSSSLDDDVFAAPTIGEIVPNN